MSITNHQRYTISVNTNKGMGRIEFTVIDPWGMITRTSEFIDTDFPQKKLQALSQMSAELQQKCVHQYLVEKLQITYSYKIHIEKHQGQMFVRFGGYGIRGGVGNWGLMGVSAFQVGGGAFLCSTGFFAPLGALSIGTGLSGGIYNLSKRQDNFNDREFAYEALVGGIVSTVSCGIGNVIGGIGGKIFGSVVGQMTGTVISAGTNMEPYPDAKKLLTSAGIGFATGAATSLVSTGAGKVAGTVAGKIVDLADDTYAFMAKAITAEAAGAAGAAANKMTNNYFLDKPLMEGVDESVVIGATIGALIALAESEVEMPSAAEAAARVRIRPLNEAEEKEYTKMYKILLKFYNRTDMTPEQLRIALNEQLANIQHAVKQALPARQALQDVLQRGLIETAKNVSEAITMFSAVFNRSTNRNIQAAIQVAPIPGVAGPRI